VTIDHWFALAIVIATLGGPIAAVQIQKSLERDRATKSRQVAVFRTMMTGRLVLNDENVKAFNSVPVEFYGNYEILQAWRAYIAHMGVPPVDPAAWDGKRVDLFLALLQKMAEQVGYDYDFVQLKEDWYRPQHFGSVETDQQKIRQGLAAILDNRAALPMELKSMPADPELNALLKKWLKQQIGPD